MAARVEPATAPAWVAGRVRSVADGVLVRGDGVAWGVVRVEPAPVALLSERELGLRVEAVRGALAGLPGAWQAVSVPRPVDLDGYLAALEAAVRDASGSRRALLREYLGYARGLVGGGEATERRHYLLVGPPVGQRWGEAEARRAAEEAAAALGRAELVARVAGAGEVVDLLAAHLQPVRRAAEPVTPAAPVTVWEGWA